MGSGWVSGLCRQLEGPGREEAPPASFLAMPTASLAWEALPPPVCLGNTCSGLRAAELMSRARLCRQSATLPLAGQVIWGKVLANSGPHFPHL